MCLKEMKSFGHIPEMSSNWSCLQLPVNYYFVKFLREWEVRVLFCFLLF